MTLREDDGNQLAGKSKDDLKDIYGERHFYVAERTAMHLLEVWSELKSALYTWNFSYTLDFAEA